MSGVKFRLPSTRLQYAGRGSSNFTFYKGVVEYGAFKSKFTLEHTVEAQSGIRRIAPLFLVEYAAISCVMLVLLSDVSTCLLLLLLSVGLPVANAPDVLQPCDLLYYP